MSLALGQIAAWRKLKIVPALVSFLSQVCVSQGTMMKAVQFEPGGPENLKIGETDIPSLREKEVLIKVYATAINRADTLQRKGLYPPPQGESLILGLEAAGTIEKVGIGSTKWQIGDRVMALVPGGGNAEYVAVREDHAVAVSKEMPFTTAAAIPEAWLTAYQLLHFVGKVQRGETVLIHAGASGVGTAAIQLVRLAGAIPIITAGSTAKIDMAKSLGAAAGFNYKEDSFSKKVLAETNDKGVDLLLDCVGASMWEQNAASMAIDGRWVQYGLLGGANINGPLLAHILRKRLTIVGSTLRSRDNQYKAELIKSFGEKALPHFSSGTLKTIIDTVMPLSKIADAHKMMEDNRNTGKIVLEVRGEESGDHQEL